MPQLWQGEAFFCDKVSKRRDQDISTVARRLSRCASVDGRIEDVRDGLRRHGRDAATRRRGGAKTAVAEATALRRRPPRSRATFEPVDDWRGSAAYRLQAAANLLRRLELRARRAGATCWRSRRYERQGPLHGVRTRHDSALKHVTGQALYIDDMPEPPGTLHGALVLSPIASGRLEQARSLRRRPCAGRRGTCWRRAMSRPRTTSRAMGQDEPLFADRHGSSLPARPLAMVVAETLDAARAAAEQVVVEIERRGADPRHRRRRSPGRPMCRRRRPCCAAIPMRRWQTAPHRLTAEFSVGGQEHFYLEGQIAFALPGEDGDLIVHSSTQHPTEVQHICAQAAGLRLQSCDGGGAPPGRRLRRQGEQRLVGRRRRGACRRAMTGRPVKLRLPREIDMVATGKRHGFDYRYTVGFDDEGRVLALDAVLAADAGWSLDLDAGRGGACAHPYRQRLLDPALPRRRLCLPHQQAVEHGLPRLRRAAGRGGDGRCARPHRRSISGATPVEVRALNFYGRGGDETPYGQKVDENHLQRCWAEVKTGGEMGAAARRDRCLQHGEPGAEARARPASR